MTGLVAKRTFGRDGQCLWNGPRLRLLEVKPFGVSPTLWMNRLTNQGTQLSVGSRQSMNVKVLRLNS